MPYRVTARCPEKPYRKLCFQILILSALQFFAYSDITVCGDRACTPIDCRSVENKFGSNQSAWFFLSSDTRLKQRRNFHYSDFLLLSVPPLRNQISNSSESIKIFRLMRQATGAERVPFRTHSKTCASLVRSFGAASLAVINLRFIFRPPEFIYLEIVRVN